MNFDVWAKGWNEQWTPEQRARLREIVLQHTLVGQCVLDVGCGAGILFPLLIEAGGVRAVVALDPSSGMLHEAQNSHLIERVLLVQAPVENAPLASDSIDTVICNSVFPHFAAPQSACSAIYRLLRPAGQLLICHVDSREAINALHSRKEEVREALLPRPAEMECLLAASGFVDVAIFDGDDHFVVWARKP